MWSGAAAGAEPDAERASRILRSDVPGWPSSGARPYISRYRLLHTTRRWSLSNMHMPCAMLLSAAAKRWFCACSASSLSRSIALCICRSAALSSVRLASSAPSAATASPRAMRRETSSTSAIVTIAIRLSTANSTRKDQTRIADIIFADALSSARISTRKTGSPSGDSISTSVLSFAAPSGIAY